MSTAIYLMMMMHQQEEERRRRRRREEERKREEEIRREEENRRMIEHRKNSPLKWNNESWQKDRCIKAINLQPCVERLISTIYQEKPSVILQEEKRHDNLLLDVGFEYEQSRKELENDIETLKKLGITIDGAEYELTRLTPNNSHIASIERTTESFGNVFSIMNGQPITLNPDILSNEGYYEDEYEESLPEEVEKAYLETFLKIGKYKKYGSYLKFLLKTKKYLALEEKGEDLTNRRRECELKKKELQSYQSLNKNQLLVIKSYFIHLDQLSKISNRIATLFNDKAHLRYESNTNIYNLTIKEIMSNDNYSELVSEVYDYITRICNNDKETIDEAYKLVKGEYPIKINNKFIYEYIIENMRNYARKDVKQKELS